MMSEVLDYMDCLSSFPGPFCLPWKMLSMALSWSCCVSHFTNPFHFGICFGNLMAKARAYQIPSRMFFCSTMQLDKIWALSVVKIEF
jgi:hypothetical protein